jgi:hypothetical protein
LRKPIAQSRGRREAVRGGGITTTRGLAASAGHALTHRQELTAGWQLTQLDGHGTLTADAVRALLDGNAGDWLDAVVPGGVHEDLVRHGRIDNPALTGQARHCKWVAESDWAYRVALPKLPVSGELRLNLAGVDTLADVWVDGERVASHDNCYLPLDVALPDSAKRLLVHFKSPWQTLESMTLEPAMVGHVHKHRLLRKPNEDFNTFNGVHPYLTPMGLYAPATLRRVGRGEITHLGIRSHLGHGLKSATVEAIVETRGLAGDSATFTLRSPCGELLASEAVTLADDGTARVSWQVDQPELWWPRGYGGQPLYEVRCESDGVEPVSKQVGLRRLEMHRPLEFLVNDVPVRLWGSNLTPLQGLSHRADPERLRVILDWCENANFTSLRVWGPGAPWPDDVYAECDRRGLLVWAEFPFTWGGYPEHDAYRQQVRAEARHMVRQLAHHPSIILWCGGNEHPMGSDLDDPGGPIFGRVLYELDLPGVVGACDPDRPYLRNSPWGGLYPNDPKVGDSHSYTHIWYVPGEEYPVCFTENTRISSPPLHSMKRILGDRLWPDESFDGRITSWRDSPMPESWGELSLGSDFALPRVGPIEHFYDTSDSPAGLVDRLDAAHADYIRKYVERYRRGRPADDQNGLHRTLGHYLWKLNDTFPMIYSTILDCFDEPNAAFFALRRAYEPVMISLEIADAVHVWVVNDTPRAVAGMLHVRLLDLFKNTDVKAKSLPVLMPPGRSGVVTTLDDFGMFDRNQAIVAELRDADGHLIHRTSDFAQIERRLKFPEARLKLDRDGDALLVSTEHFARRVHLTGAADGQPHGGAFNWRFSDNHFDLLPGEPHRVQILGPARGEVTAASAFNPHTATMSFR